MKSVPLVLLTIATFAQISFGQSARDQVQLDDAGLSQSFPRYPMVMQGDGTLRVAMWVDRRDSDDRDAICCAVSTDRGVSFGPKISVYDHRSSFIDVDNARLAVANGVIYISFDDDRAGSSTPTAVVMRSVDQGATWTQSIIGTDFDDPEIDASGDTVLVLMKDDSARPHILHAVVSTDQGQSFSAPAPLSAGHVADATWAGIVDGTSTYATWFDDSAVAGDNDLYFSKATAGGTWTAPVRVDQDASGLVDTDYLPNIAAGGGNIYITYLDDERNGVSFARDLAKFCVSNDGGASWTETSISTLNQDADYLNLGADGNTVAITWSDYTNGAYDSANVVVSTDGGASFGPKYTVPSAGSAGLDDHRNMNIFVEDGRVLLSFASTAYSVTNDEYPAYSYSVDAGTSWNGPFLAGHDFATEGDIDTQGTAWLFANGSLSGLWRSDEGHAIFAGGIRFPFIEAVNNGNSTVTFSLGGADATLGSASFARWAASEVLGVVAHPENAAEMLGLGSSFVLNYTLNHPRNFAAPIAADGTAARTFGTGALAGTFYVQGWVNVGPSISGGTTTSDVVEVIL